MAEITNNCTVGGGFVCKEGAAACVLGTVPCYYCLIWPKRERGECAALWENERGGHWWLVYSLHRSAVLMHQTHSFVLWVNTLSRHDTSSHTLGYVDSYRFRDWTHCRGRGKLPARELLLKLHRAVATHQQLRRKCITLICSHRREWGSVCGEWTWFLNFLNLWEFERWRADGGGWVEEFRCTAGSLASLC